MSQINDELKNQTFCMHGNKYGDYFKLEQINDRLLKIEIGHCCVVHFNHIIPIEWLTGVLCNTAYEIVPDLREDVCKGMLKKILPDWGEKGKFTKQLLSEIKPIDGFLF